MSLTEAQARVHTWISQFEEGYFHPLTNMTRLAEEVGELAREVNHRFGQKTKKKEESEGDLAMEMADILFVLICMANREGIDLQQAFDRMMAKVEVRDKDRWNRKGERRTGARGNGSKPLFPFSRSPVQPFSRSPGFTATIWPFAGSPGPAALPAASARPASDRRGAVTGSG